MYAIGSAPNDLRNGVVYTSRVKSTKLNASTQHVLTRQNQEISSSARASRLSDMMIFDLHRDTYWVSDLLFTLAGYSKLLRSKDGNFR